tara:strand:+ start:313 stop:858 length:546 start_codon:yes stop_codon:yes gene_type:complete
MTFPSFKDEKNLHINVKLFNYNYTNKLLKIFNSARVRGFFYRKKKVKLKDHVNFLKNNFGKRKSFIYLAFLKNDNNPFGYVRYDKLKKIGFYEMSIAILPKYYGKNLGTLMMARSLEKFKKKKFKKIVAVVKIKNPRSWKCFLKNKFKISKCKNKKNIVTINPLDFKKEYYLYLNFKRLIK